MRIPFISLAAAVALALGGCAYGGLDVGLGYGGGYGDYGYGSPYYGYGYGPYGGYGAYPGYYGGFGWYGDYYYPGTGIYVYDSYRRPRVWSSRERSYWTSRRPVATTSGIRTTTVSPNWAGFSRRPQQIQTREVRQQQQFQGREERRQQQFQTREERRQRRHD
jgi:hypothetical protein